MSGAFQHEDLRCPWGHGIAWGAHSFIHGKVEVPQWEGISFDAFHRDAYILLRLARRPL